MHLYCISVWVKSIKADKNKQIDMTLYSPPATSTAVVTASATPLNSPGIIGQKSADPKQIAFFSLIAQCISLRFQDEHIKNLVESTDGNYG